MRHPIGIEKLLVWAYREELPKRQWIESLGLGNSFGGASMLGTRIADGGVQPYAEMIAGGIAGDALKVEQAVDDLAGMRLEIADPLVLVDDMPELLPDVMPALAGHTLLLHGLVARFAIIAEQPPWQCERPLREMVKDARSGAPLWFVVRKVRCRAGATRFYEEREADGYDRIAHRPMPGAYRRYVWGEPGVRAVADLRFDYLAWALAMQKLAESLSRVLTRFSVEIVDGVSLPWGGSVGERARLVRPAKGVETPPLPGVAELAGERAWERLQQRDRRGLTATGT